jgi:predicted nucleic acid-binding protein
MGNDRFLLDTFFIQALLNKHDAYHEHARDLLPFVRDAREVWVTEAVLVEVANALSVSNRAVAVAFIRQCYETPNMHVVSVDEALLAKALNLYEARRDKTWGLTDCISFVVMDQQSIVDALTADTHFVQARYRALLLGQK